MRKRQSMVPYSARSLAHEWGRYDGYHPLDTLLAERLMERELQRRGLERRAPVFIDIVPTEDGEGEEWFVMSPDRGAVERVVEGLQRGGLPILARPIARPEEEDLERLFEEGFATPMFGVGEEEDEDYDRPRRRRRRRRS